MESISEIQVNKWSIHTQAHVFLARDSQHWQVGLAITTWPPSSCKQQVPLSQPLALLPFATPACTNYSINYQYLSQNTML
jgi:hypothetical protein